MVFSSLTFLFLFLPLALVLYFAVRGRALRNAVLLIVSLLFYAWGEPIYVLLMLISTLNDYGFARLVGRAKELDHPVAARLYFILSLVVNLSLLGVFKYGGFIMENLAAIGLPVSGGALPLPIGISFYTFQTMSYSIDVYRGQLKPQRNLLKMATYVTLFPQLIAGPIVRYSDVEESLSNRTDSLDNVAAGMRRFIPGLAKKVLIANQMGLVASAVFDQPAAESGTIAIWVGALAYMFQIYYDFSGYSDMAIGLGLMFGFHFPENFRLPYRSRSITEFWRRWHISLSSWFKDYVYIPLGGNRTGIARQIVNLLLVWFLTGLWHGASWNFVLWGLYYGVLLILEKFLWKARWEMLPVILRHAFTLLLVLLGWVLFRVEALPELIRFLGRMFTPHAISIRQIIASQQEALKALLFFVPAIAFAFGPIREKSMNLREESMNSREKTRNSSGNPWWHDIVLLFLLVICLVFLFGERFNPFIYFRF